MEWDSRWRQGDEVEGLTWGVLLDGKQVLDTFIKLGCVIRPNDIVLEVGPGYGRIFEAFRKKFQFKRWYMVEVNPTYCKKLGEKFKEDTRLKILNQDVNQLSLPEPFDIGISTLTFLHLYPDFSQGLGAIIKHIKSNGRFLLELPPPSRDQCAYCDYGAVQCVINSYSEKSVLDFIELSGASLESSGVVQYEVEGKTQILYCIRKSSIGPNEILRRIRSLERTLAILRDHANVIAKKTGASEIYQVFGSS